MSDTKIYSVKSNASRAAVKAGLTRQDILPVTDGWIVHQATLADPIGDVDASVGLSIVSAAELAASVVYDESEYADDAYVNSLTAVDDVSEPCVQYSDGLIIGEYLYTGLTPIKSEDWPDTKEIVVTVNFASAKEHAESLNFSVNADAAIEKPSRKYKGSPAFKGRRCAQPGSQGRTRDLVERMKAGWVVMEEIMREFDWRRSETFRGALGYARKNFGVKTECERRGGKTCYRIVEA